MTEAASLCQKLPPGTIDALEEPIRDEAVEAFEVLRSMTPVPFALGEEFASKWQFLPFVEKGLANFCRVDIINVGGFTETMKVAGWCEAHYVDLMPHNLLAPSARRLAFTSALRRQILPRWRSSRTVRLTQPCSLFTTDVRAGTAPMAMEGFSTRRRRQWGWEWMSTKQS